MENCLHACTTLNIEHVRQVKNSVSRILNFNSGVLIRVPLALANANYIQIYRNRGRFGQARNDRESVQNPH